MQSRNVDDARSANATQDLVEFLVATTEAVIPASAMEAAKVVILDGVANLAAASTHPVAVAGRGYFSGIGGRAEATAVGVSERLPAPSAAWVNGLTLHCLDYEVQGLPPCHGTSSILPALLALGEKHSRTGRDLIASFVLGWEVQQRIRRAGFDAPHRGFHFPGIIGPVASAAASAKLVGLDAQSMSMAVAIAASRTGGLFANNGTMTKATHPANTARTGVEAVELVLAGFNASTVVLEDQQGYVNALFGHHFDWDVLREGLGERYELVDTGFSIKRYPAEIYMQWVIEAASMLREREDLDPEAIEEIVIDPPTLHLDLSRPEPKSGLDGKFSYEYCTVVGLLEERVSIASFTDDVRFSPAVNPLLKRVRIEHTSGKTRQDPWAGIRVVTRSGTIHELRCDSFRGSITNPMSPTDRTHKVLDCFRSVGRESLGVEAIEVVQHLDDRGQGIDDLLGVLARI